MSGTFIPVGSSYDPQCGNHTMDAMAIVENYANMCCRPEYFSARGARLGDLCGQQLEQIYQGISEHVGPAAALNYAQMVADLPSLSATAFLTALYTLERNKWLYVFQNPTGFALAGYGEALVADAIHTIANTISRGTADDTPQIRRGFIQSHLHEIKQSPALKRELTQRSMSGLL